MKRRRQCPARPTALIAGRSTFQCQRRAEHDGPHKASHSQKSTRHFSWRDGATIFEYATLPGRVRYRVPFWNVVRVVRTLKWAAYLAYAVALWLLCPVAAALFLGAGLLTAVRRCHFLDFGRFTAGLWPVPTSARAPIFGIAWVLHTDDRAGPKAGLEVVIGRVGMGAFSLMRRSEWAEYKRNKAKRLAGKGDLQP